MPDGSGPRPATPSRTRASAPHKPRDLDAERNSRILLIIGIVVAISAVVAGVVIFTGGDGTTTATPTTQPHVQASGTALVMGKHAGVRHQVVVYEDFACPACRDFETSSRDFLQAAALKGVVRVEYRPFHLLPAAYSTQALGAWGAVLQHGTAAQALALHDLLYDRQPAAGASQPTASALEAWARKAGATAQSVLGALGSPDPAFVGSADAAAAKAGVTGTPAVFVDGRRLPGTTALALADTLQRIITGG